MTQSTDFINYHVEELQQMESLSQRALNVCYEGALDTLFKILYYYLEHTTFREIRNCGLKTNIELIDLSKKYINTYGVSFYNLRLSEPELKFEEFKFFCFENFQVSSLEMNQFKEAFIARDFPLARFVTIVIKHILNEREKFIFENNFGFTYSSQRKTLQIIGDQYSITRERVRQISMYVPEKIFNAVKMISDRLVTFEKHFNYKLDLKKEIIAITPEMVADFNEKESLNYTGKFYNLIFSAVFSKYFIQIQDISNNYRNYYLIARKYKPVFDFENYISNIEEQKSIRHTSNQSIDFMEYLSRFTFRNQQINDRLKQICKRIAIDEFELGFDKTYIVFKRNSMIKLSEHIIDILNTVGRPMKLSEIGKELKNRSKKVPPSQESLRSSILSISEVVAIGKTSTYALKTWPSVNTGTIKSIVKDFLEKAGEPKHISDITVYVCKFRKTTDKNILSNLKLDKSNTFAFFKLGYIGLKFKQYKNIQIQGVQKPRGRKPKSVKDSNQLSLL